MNNNDFKIIFINDGSKDKTLEVINLYCRKNCYFSIVSLAIVSLMGALILVIAVVVFILTIIMTYAFGKFVLG